ncbi:MAG: sensor histidine kinase [Gemmatimonadales bacterium]
MAGSADSAESISVRRARAGRVVLGVAAAWLLIGVVMGAQTSFGSALTGGPPAPLWPAVRDALIQTVPWIPASLLILVLAIRYPLSGPRRVRNGLIHLAASVPVVFLANALVVLGYWITFGPFQSLGVLMREGARWGLLRLHIGLLVYAAVVAITLTMRYYQQSRDNELRLVRLEGQLTRARLQALNAQMRPHFLFNTLHTIGHLWRSGANDAAEAALDNLGNLFHRVQNSTQASEVSLAEELAMVREYLAIEQARFRDRLEVVIDADDAALDWKVPPLILQPLVENAVRHGISARSSAGKLRVTAAVVDNRLRLVVGDDGPGMDAVSPQPGSGTGLSNTRERLFQLHGADARLEIESAPATGTVATVWLPRGVPA